MRRARSASRTRASALTLTLTARRAPARRRTGLGLYRYLSRVNHSCSPCVKLVHLLGTNGVRVVALRDVAAGEELTFAYGCYETEEPLPAYLRRELLLQEHGFLCACEACEADMDTDGVGSRPELVELEVADITALVGGGIPAPPPGWTRISVLSAEAGLEHEVIVDVKLDGSAPPVVRRTLTGELLPMTDSIRRAVSKIRTPGDGTLDLSRLAKPSLAVKNVVNPQRCAVCGEPGLSRCSRCGRAPYCSKACQKSDWEAGHKTACAAPA